MNRSLAANARGAIGNRGELRSGRLLGIIQVALSLVLLMGAALFLRSLTNLLSQNLGYDRAHLLMVKLDPSSAGYQGRSAVDLYQRIQRELERLPAVRSVTLSNSGLFGGDSGDHLAIEGSPIQNPEDLHSSWTEVGSEYFKTLGIRMLRGRAINASDVAKAAQVCVINESFQRRFYPGIDPIGRHIKDQYPTTRETFEIIGLG